MSLSPAHNEPDGQPVRQTDKKLIGSLPGGDDSSGRETKKETSGPEPERSTETDTHEGLTVSVRVLGSPAGHLKAFHKGRRAEESRESKNSMLGLSSYKKASTVQI